MWFEDEARVGQQGTYGAIWNEVGSRPAVARDDRHDSVWLFGSVCPQRAAGSALVMPWVGSEAMSLHLEALSKMVSPGAHAVLVCDGAGWHQTGGRLVVPDNITLLPLPSYSPQLNPIENVWAYLRGNYLNRRVWASYDQIVDACCAAWNAFISDTNRVSSITQREWATVNNQGRWYNTLYAGGYKIESPVGAIWSSNITPSLTFGIGHYTEAEFARALREGVRQDGAHLYPAMPYRLHQAHR